MKVYVVLDNNWQHYEGGGAEIVSIHNSEDSALAKVEAELKPYGVKMKDRANEPNSWYYVDNVGGEDRWFSIEEHNVIGEETS